MALPATATGRIGVILALMGTLVVIGNLRGGSLPGQAGGGSSSVGFCAAVCGDNIIMAPEECDDGGLNSNATPNACRTSCKKAHCGDGITDAGELCDDGNVTNSDGCSSNCQKEPAVCGNGRLETLEQCDDGNTANNDCCSAQCQIEQGCSCVTGPAS
jgi:cysteine-rich repeat protein